MEEETRQVVFETNGKTYKELYDNIIEENLRNPPPEGENTIEHHIKPKSIFPDLRYSKENLVRLTEKSHLKVHYLLWQHYKRETEDRDSEEKMCMAFWNMVHEIEWKGDTELGWIADRYEELRVDFRKKISGDNSPTKRPDVRAKISKAIKETLKNPEVRAKLSEAKKEAWKRPEARVNMSEAMRNWHKNNPDKNPSKRPEVRVKISESRKGVKNPTKRPDVRAKISKAKKEAWKRPEARVNMSEAIKEAMKRPEVRAKFMGDNNVMKRPEVRAKFMGDNNVMKRPDVRAKKFKKVLQYSIDGTFIAEYPSLKDAAIKTNSHVNGISLCCTGKRKTHNGFVWKYAENK